MITQEKTFMYKGYEVDADYDDVAVSCGSYRITKKGKSIYETEGFRSIEIAIDNAKAFIDAATKVGRKKRLKYSWMRIGNKEAYTQEQRDGVPDYQIAKQKDGRFAMKQRTSAMFSYFYSMKDAMKSADDNLNRITLKN